MLYQFKEMIVSMFLAVSLNQEPIPAIDIDKINETACLSQAIYMEAGNQSMAGKLAVGHVIVNRTKHPAYKETSICKVIRQKSQFGFLRNVKKIDTKKYGVEAQMRSSIEASLMVMSEDAEDNTQGAISFSNLKKDKYIKWTRKMHKTVRIGDHTFYRFKT